MKWLSLLVVSAALSATAHAVSLRDQVAHYNRQDMARLASVLKSGVTTDFQYIDSGHSMNCDKMLEMMKMGLKAFTTIKSADSKILSMKESKDSATGVFASSVVGTMLGPDKKAHTFGYVATYDESYSKVKGTWKMAKMTFKSWTATMDGKPFDPSKTAPKG